MLRYVAGRLILVIPTVLGMVTIAFFTLRALPGDPAIAILGEFATEQALQDLRVTLGLDQPLWVQFGRFVHGLLTGDLGRSAITRQPAMREVMSVLPPSLMLAGFSVLIAIMAGLPIGVVSALRQGSWVDYLLMVVTISGISFPVFWIGLIMIVLFAHTIKLFPAVGAGSPGDLISQAHAMVLPAIVLAAGGTAYIARLTRSAMLEILRQDYMLVAKAMGIRERRILWYGLRNALPPILGVIGVTFAVAIGNAVLVEVVFSRPGLGSLIIKATFSRDYQLLQAGLLVLSISVVLVNLVLDLLYPLVDPRVRR
ncbi:MAG: ABC transporter permease [Alphaproteobacteria bacterium]|nr:ABC transporter permease [Alphaproteobacteria bacterium]